MSEDRILIAGSSGFVGSNLLKRLIDSKKTIRATYHIKQPQIQDPNVEYVQCDLTDSQQCHEVCKNVDTVFMCAANTSGAAVIEQTPLAHVTPNVLMNTLMLEAAYNNRVNKFVFLSSNTVYPNTTWPADEDSVNNTFFYKYFCVAWMKRFSEILCQMYSKHIKTPMQTIVVRPGNIYGEYDDFEFATAHVIPSLIRKIVERHDPLEVWGDGKDVKDFIYIDDFIDGLMLLVSNTPDVEAINIAGGQSYSIRDIVSTLCKIQNWTPNIMYDDSKPTMIPFRAIDINLARKLIGFEPKTSLEDGLRNTVQWYKKVRGLHV